MDETESVCDHRPYFSRVLVKALAKPKTLEDEEMKIELGTTAINFKSYTLE